MNAEDAAVRAYYDQGQERGRLGDAKGQLEFIRTTEILARRLPPPPAVVADIGGGPGRYALWLASLGYQVEHRDLMPLHVSQLRTEAARAWRACPGWPASARTCVPPPSGPSPAEPTPIMQ